MVLMMNPRVGLMLFTSSFITRFTIVVFPALSSPLKRLLAASFELIFSTLTASEFSSPYPSVLLCVKLIALCNFVGVERCLQSRRFSGLPWEISNYLVTCDELQESQQQI